MVYDVPTNNRSSNCRGNRYTPFQIRLLIYLLPHVTMVFLRFISPSSWLLKLKSELSIWYAVCNFVMFHSFFRWAKNQIRRHDTLVWCRTISILRITATVIATESSYFSLKLMKFTENLHIILFKKYLKNLLANIGRFTWLTNSSSAEQSQQRIENEHKTTNASSKTS